MKTPPQYKIPPTREVAYFGQREKTTPFWASDRQAVPGSQASISAGRELGARLCPADSVHGQDLRWEGAGPWRAARRQSVVTGSFSPARGRFVSSKHTGKSCDRRVSLRHARRPATPACWIRLPKLWGAVPPFRPPPRPAQPREGPPATTQVSEAGSR